MTAKHMNNDKKLLRAYACTTTDDDPNGKKASTTIITLLIKNITLTALEQNRRLKFDLHLKSLTDITSPYRLTR